MSKYKVIILLEVSCKPTNYCNPATLKYSMKCGILCLFPILFKKHKGATPRGWFVSEVLGGDWRTTDGTRDGFKTPTTLGESGRWIRNEVKGGGLGLALAFCRRPPLPTGAGGCEPTLPCQEGSKNHPGGS